MSEYAAYHYITEQASLIELAEFDAKPWPATFEEYLNTFYDEDILRDTPSLTPETLLEAWKGGVWQDGMTHALRKARLGLEPPERTWWNAKYQQAWGPDY